MILSVWFVEWCLDEDRRVLRVGDVISSWLTFEESERRPIRPTERLQTVRGVVRPLARWPGAEDGRHPVAIDVDGGTLYWDAPAPVTSTVEVAGAISYNNIDAPDGFPHTRGVIRRVRMEWRTLATDASTRYEDLAASYLPTSDAWTEDPSSDTVPRWTGCLIDLDISDQGRG